MKRFLALILLLTLVGCGGRTSPSVKPAPDFTLEDLAAKKVSLSEFRGKVVLLDFWGVT